MRETDLAGLLDRVRSGDSLAIARAITAIENATPLGADLRLAVRGASGLCQTLGVTGPPGAGKSSLVSALISILLEQYPRIGVLTVDPSSPVSGGAVLGDRVRMAAHSRDPNVFIRSLAARGHLGGVTRTTRGVIDILAAAGFDLVIVETVGTGQSEVAVAGITDVKLVVCPPGLGDDMQAIKAGVLEIADLLVVNKADLPDAGRTAGYLKAMLYHRGHDETRAVLLASATTGDGLKELAEAVDARFAALGAANPGEAHLIVTRDVLADDAADLIRAFIRHADIDRLCGTVGRGELTHREGAIAAVNLFVDSQGSKE
ncbi:methylmalonyl Co-A mutase-associated GTPase MeaB [Sphingomonas glacialis]|uniref:methylmalonyl Co-A mutase-associated GTPase MeaB n=1 Tax=Sphingomonas glacialis TaxID=658225 RepID=UPI001E29C3AD|nr:methylmalonyl Co-A mutase-associated GTPase MeaB [Sphingomonas glacialis]